MGNFQELKVWQQAKELAVFLYKISGEGPFAKDWGLKDQMRRAVVSIPSNIAEGAERSSDKDFIRFLQYSKGSCGELRTQIYIGIDIGYIDAEKGKEWIQETKEISAMLVGFIKKLSATSCQLSEKRRIKPKITDDLNGINQRRDINPNLRAES